MAENPVKDGTFVTCEGGEGVGKTLFLNSLSQRLKGLGVSTLLTREPGGTSVGEQIRALFNHPPDGETLCPEAELFLLSAARAQHVNQRIQPALKRGLWVLCDRFYDSTWVYQGVLKGLSKEVLAGFIKTSTFGLNPRLTLLLDCPTDVAMERLQRREEEKSLGFRPTRFDKSGVETHGRIREAFLSLAQESPERIAILDARVPTRDMVDLAIGLLRERGLLL